MVKHSIVHEIRFFFIDQHSVVSNNFFQPTVQHF